MFARGEQGSTAVHWCRKEVVKDSKELQIVVAVIVSVVLGEVTTLLLQLLVKYE